MNRRILFSGLALLAAPALIAASQALPRALQQAQPGLWEISDPSGGRPTQRICLRDMSALAQVEHQGRQCTRVTIKDEAGMAEIHYTCMGGGFGRSTLEPVTPRNFRIVTQGIDRGLPFHYSLAARRLGGCS